MMPVMQTKQFQKTVEDFVCSNCGVTVKGTGYTNHCPHCLWSRHVDVNPGDRASTCGGMMKPVAVEKKGDEYTVIQQCIVCGHKRKNKILKEDNFDVVIKLSVPETER
jgi:hypothetical protein